MSVLELAGVIAVVWMVSFLSLLLPGRWIGMWIDKSSPNTFSGILFSVAIAKLFVVCIALVLVLARFSDLPHVNADKDFAIIFAGLFLFVPAFVALFVGFRRSRAQRKHTMMV
ncbi:hypothetical protein WHZ77_15415 [Bradyrhizobium sp. A5]|uniref:hypothetical protein n=1 Tax=Bradyrhizobium sp. A5 TaxID=3133696 RepID=UPI003245FEEC